MNAIQVKAQRLSGFLGTAAGSVGRPRSAWVTLSTAKRSWWWVPALPTVLTIVFTVATYGFASCHHVYQLEMDYCLSHPDEMEGIGLEPGLL